MKKLTTQKIVSVLLVLAMLLTMVPVSVFAADGDKASVTDKDGNVIGTYMTFADAVTAAEGSEGSTLTLLGAVTVPQMQSINSGKFTIDLNGKVLLNETATYALSIGSNADLTIKDSGEGGTVKTNAAGSYAIISYGTLTVESGTITGTGGIDNRGTLTFNGGTAEGSANYAIRNDGTAYVYGGKLISSGTEGSIDNNTNGILYVYGGEISGSKYAMGNVGTAYIKGGKFTGNSHAALNLLSGTVEITGGCFTGKDKYGSLFGVSNGEWTVYYTDGVTLTLKGGEFPNGFAVYGANANTFLADGYAFYDADGNKITVADDAKVVSGYVQVKEYFAASVTDKDGNVTNYKTLPEAVTAAGASEGCTVTLLDDVELTETLSIDNGTFTIDINGYDISYSFDTSVGGSNWYSAIEVASGTEITIDDSADEKGTISGAGSGVSIGWGTLILKDVTVKGGYNGAVVSADCKLIVDGATIIGEADHGINLDGVVEMKSGSVSSNGIGVNTPYEYASFTMTGGTVSGETVDIRWDGGVVDISALADPEGITFMNYDGYDVSASQFPLAAGYAFFDSEGNEVTELKSEVVYTIGKAVVSNSKVLSVEYPQWAHRGVNFTVKVEGRASKIQFVEVNNTSSTVTYTRAGAEIVSYNEAGEVVDSLSREVAYEVWTIYATVNPNTYYMRAKYGYEWEDVSTAYSFEYKLSSSRKEIYSTSIETETPVVGEAFDITLETGLDVVKVQVVLNGTVLKTFAAPEFGEDKAVFNVYGKCYRKGENTITFKIKTADGWEDVPDLSYTVIGQ